jgi:hypothetical protein
LSHRSAVHAIHEVTAYNREQVDRQRTDWCPVDVPLTDTLRPAT